MVRCCKPTAVILTRVVPNGLFLDWHSVLPCGEAALLARLNKQQKNAPHSKNAWLADATALLGATVQRLST